jgi:hypothetical protein
MTKSRILGALSAVLFTFITVSANAALVSRLGGAAAYDDVLDITWLTDANLSGGNANWDSQLLWIDSLNTANHLGFDDWRLASMSVTAGVPDAGFQITIDSCTTGVACPTNELGHMYYFNMGGALFDDKTGNQTVDGVLLTDVQADYWSGTEFGPNNAWVFGFDKGEQSDNQKILGFSGWAVRSGDVSAVPVPAAAWLFGSALIGLVGFKRKK